MPVRVKLDADGGVGISNAVNTRLELAMKNMGEIMACLVIAAVVMLLLAITINGVFFTEPDVVTNMPMGVTRFVDDEAGVVCWKYNRGLSCLPIGDTTLRIGE